MLILTVYGQYQMIRNDLKQLEIPFTERDVLNNFWGIEFKVAKPCGKGAKDKLNKLYQIGFNEQN
jgi:hypothetical protein